MKLEDLKVGEKDQRGRQIREILWTIEGSYVIYRHAGGITPHFSDKKNTKKRQLAAYAKIGPLLASVNALRSGLIGRTKCMDREIARGVMQTLEEDLTSAKSTLLVVRDRLRNLRTIEGRLLYQAGSFAAVLVVILFYTAARLWVTGHSQAELPPLRVMLICMFGAIGGFLSVSVGIKRLDIDPDADWWINAVAGGSRILIAIIGSLFVYLAIASKLMFGELPQMQTEPAILAISIVAGFSETIVPNVIGRLASTPEQHRSKPPDSQLLAGEESHHPTSS